VITTVAGSGAGGFRGDGGPASAAKLFTPQGVVTLADGSFLIADTTNERIRGVSASGVITTVVGNGAPGFTGDGGPGTSAALHSPHSLASLPGGGFLIADRANCAVREVSASGTITTVAGLFPKKCGLTGDGGPVPPPRRNFSIPRAWRRCQVADSWSPTGTTIAFA
jgi:hypothetical protein